jgi:hypothetical protein
MLDLTSHTLRLAALSAAVLFSLLAVALAALWWCWRPRKPARQEPSHQGSPQPGFTICPDCGKEVRSRRLQSHRSSTHGTVKRCRLCNTYIRVDRVLRHNTAQHDVESPELLKPPSVQCTRCHNTVLRKNIVEHLGRHHDVNLHPTYGWHPLVAARYRGDAHYWLIDGQSIARIQGAETPRFDLVLALTYHLLQENADFLCVFGASARARLREVPGSYLAECYGELIHTFPRRFSEVPAGTVAAEAISEIVSILGPTVITNERYQSYAGQWPWPDMLRDEMLSRVTLQRDPRRREFLVWKDRTIPVPRFQTIPSFVRRYKQQLSQRESTR